MDNCFRPLRRCTSRRICRQGSKQTIQTVISLQYKMVYKNTIKQEEDELEEQVKAKKEEVEVMKEEVEVEKEELHRLLLRPCQVIMIGKWYVISNKSWHK